MRGHLYILSNPAIPNLLKIGYTKRTVVQRIEELMTTGVPGAFEIEFFAEVEHARQLERDIHRKVIGISARPQTRVLRVQSGDRGQDR
jgi:hypothetical protein